MEKIIFQSDDGTTAEFYVEEQTNIAGVTYLLVSDSQDEEADAYILKDISAPGSTEACYEMVEDEGELQAVYAVFQQMLDAFVLLLLSDVQKQFDQQVAVVAQLAFKDADFLQTALVLLDREAARLILADGLVHPAGIEEEEFAVFRDVFHVTVQKRLGKLLGCGTGHRDDLKEAWVHRCNHRSDAAALSGSTPTFHQHNDRKGALFDQ